MTDNTDFNPENLKPLIGEHFTVTDAEGGVTQLQLVGIEEEVIKGFDGESFMVDFQGDPNALPHEGSYKVHHEKTGEIELMLSLSSDSHCEAVVSRFRK